MKNGAKTKVLHL